MTQEVKHIVESFDDNKDFYEECRRIEKELLDVGYTCDWGLDGVIFDVKPKKELVQ